MAGPAKVVEHLLAVQAQDYAGAKWALAQRSAATTDAEVDDLVNRGAILRTHVLRPTWHFVAPTDLRWLLALTAPRVHAASGYQYRLLELDDATFRRSEDAMARALSGGVHLTRAEIGRVLGEAGIPSDGLRLGYLVMHAELEAVICSGARRGRRQTYALVDERVPPAAPRTRDEALEELARRFVAGHGPAQAADLAWWSGLTMTDARRALELASPRLVRETHGERTFWASDSADVSDSAEASGRTDRPDRPGPVIHLLPNYDELLIAFRDRSDALDPSLPADARSSESLLAHIVVRDGLIVGGWRRTLAGTSVGVALRSLVPLGDAERVALAAEAERLGRFLGRPVVLSGA